MITQIAVCQADPEIDLGISGQGAARLVSSLFGPTQGCREDPGTEVYRERLESMDDSALQYEATGFACTIPVLSHLTMLFSCAS